MDTNNEQKQKMLDLEARMRRDTQLEREGRLLVDTLPLPIRQDVLDALKELAKSRQSSTEDQGESNK